MPNIKQIIKTHIENDLVNNDPRLVYTDSDGTEWVVRSCTEGIYLEEKSKSWYYDPKNIKSNDGGEG